MPPRKKKTAATPPLSDADVKELAFRVKGGDSPRVIVRSASAAVPAGTRGNVIRIGNPSEGEYIVVRLGRDQVPFAPNELSLSTRGRASTASSPAAARPAPAARPAAKKTAAASSRPSRASARSTAKAATKAAKSSPAKTAKATKAAPARAAATQRAAAPAKEAAKAATRAATSASTRTSGRGSRRSKGRSPQPLTVTMRFADSRWTIEAQRGSRRLAKVQPLRPGAVSAFAEHVDEQAVRDALVETVESCRAVVQEKAAVLRAELDAAEAALREYDARRR